MMKMPARAEIFNSPNSELEDFLRLCCVSNSSSENLTQYQLMLFQKLEEFLPQLHRLIPILNKVIKHFGNFDSIQASTLNLLQVSTQQAAAKVIAHQMQLNRICELFAQQNIPFILLKGSAFIDYIYDNDAPRLFNDLDILIHSEHWQQAITLLETDMVYASKKTPGQFEDLYEVSYLPKNKVGYHLDLHKTLVHPFLFNIDEPELWKNTVKHPKYQDENIRVLIPELNILHLAIHAYKDMDFYKYNLVDCHKIIECQTVDWQKLLNVASNWGCETPLYCLLYNCKKVINTDIPNDVLATCSPNKITKKLASMLLRSEHRQPSNDKKTFQYRCNQLLSQFVFTRSIIRPLRLQFSYLSTVVRTS